MGTGVAISLPAGYAGFVHPRSGLAARHGISIVNAPGTVDAGYRGEIKVCLINTDRRHPVSIARGDRIAQLVIQPVSMAAFVPVTELPSSARGIGGYGSTGGILGSRPHRGQVRPGGHPARGREHEWAKGTRMIFKRGRKRGSDSAVEDSTEDVGVDELAEPAEAADDESTAEDGGRGPGRLSRSSTGGARDPTTSPKSTASRVPKKAPRSISAA